MSKGRRRNLESLIVGLCVEVSFEQFCRRGRTTRDGCQMGENSIILEHSRRTSVGPQQLVQGSRQSWKPCLNSPL